VFWGGNEVAESSFDVKVNEKKNVILPVSTVKISEFSLNAQKANEKSTAKITDINYNIKNVFNGINDAKLVLKVYFDKDLKGISVPVAGEGDLKNQKAYEKKLIEEVKILQAPVIEVGSQSGRGFYVPAKGWKNGVYRFRLELYGKGKTSGKDVLYGSSKEIDVYVNNDNSGLYKIIIVFIFITVIFVLYIISKRSNRKKDVREIHS